jgi:NAD(P)-dependent dehydrogenase (short-subunit alcohol dehydrogenase family)
MTATEHDASGLPRGSGVPSGVAIVTGAGNGIGAAIARRLGDAGAGVVVVADLDGDAAARVAAELGARGQRATARRVDVADRDAVTELVAAAEGFGPLELVVSNAGIGTGEGVDADLAVWQRAWEVNVLAHVHAAAAALPGMLERGRGVFVHTCSAAGLLTMVGDAPYAVTKHAAVAFAEWLAVTYGARGIRVHALCPQGVATDLLEEGTGSVAAAAVRLSGEVLTPEQVADDVVAGLADGRFLILPHAEVATHLARKAQDPDRWIGALQRITATLDPPA